MQHVTRYELPTGGGAPVFITDRGIERILQRVCRDSGIKPPSTLGRTMDVAPKDLLAYIATRRRLERELKNHDNIRRDKISALNNRRGAQRKHELRAIERDYAAATAFLRTQIEETNGAIVEHLMAARTKYLSA